MLICVQGFDVVLPDRATMEHTVIPAIEALNRKDMEGACNLLRIALQVLLVRAANFIILASDDMRDLLPPDDPLIKKCIDPMDALARSTIKWVKSSGHNTWTTKESNYCISLVMYQDSSGFIDIVHFINANSCIQNTVIMPKMYVEY